MEYYLNQLFSLSIAIGAIIGWIRFRKTDPAFLPFLWYLWVGLFNELIGTAIVAAGYSNAIFYNLFSLFEGLVITLQFRNWGSFESAKWKYPVIQLTNLIVWLTTILLFNNNGFNSYYTIIHSILIVVLSVNMVNDLLFTRHRSLLRQPIFLICMSFIILFTYTIMVEALWVFGINQSHAFRVHVLEIMAYINCLTNLVFALAILWMPMKRTYILQSL